LCYGPGLSTDSCRGYTLYASCNECCAKSPGLWQEKKPEPSDPTWKDTADEWNCRPGEIDATKCGVGYCEHHREGLPVCVECREESTLAHDKACAQLAEARAEIEALMFLVKNQRCCRNCGNHASWQFDICGFGENPQDENEGPHCRRNDLKRWRPMEYRRAKEAAERGE
jgi:hypothetical protein